MATNNGTSQLRVEAIDVEQGDSLLVEGPTGDTMLIDSGHWLDEGERVLNHLDNRGIDHLDYLVSTHDDADHIGGHAAIIEAFGPDRIGAVLGPDTAETASPDTRALNRYENTLEAHGMEEKELREGSSTIDLDGVDVDVLNPSPKIDSNDRNVSSLVLQCTYGEQSILLTGDTVDEAEVHLVDNYSDQLRNVDVLKSAHHGDDKGTGAELLMTCEPETVVFSHGVQNQHDHPNRNTLARTRLADTDVVSTAVHGSTAFTLDGEETIAVEHERAVETRDVADVTAMIHVAREHGREQLQPTEELDGVVLPEQAPP